MPRVFLRGKLVLLAGEAGDITGGSYAYTVVLLVDVVCHAAPKKGIRCQSVPKSNTHQLKVSK